MAHLRAPLQHVEDVARQVRGDGAAAPLPEREPAALGALERLQLLQGVPDDALEARGIDAGKPERVAEVGGEEEREGGRGALLGAPVRILDEVARTLPQAHERGGAELHVQPPVLGDDARR